MMKIDVLELIENALIGGKHGDTAFEPNHEFIYNLYQSKTYFGRFKEFLQDVISEADAEHLERLDKKRKEELMYFQRSTGLSFKDIARLATELDTTQEKEI